MCVRMSFGNTDKGSHSAGPCESCVGGWGQWRDKRHGCCVRTLGREQFS